MAVANHEGSILSFPGLSGIFTHTLNGVLNYGAPFPNTPGSTTGVIIAQAVQTVNIVENTVAEPLNVLGHTGIAGYGKRAGTVDVTIDAVLTSGIAIGKALTSYESTLAGFLTLTTTDGAVTSSRGKQAVVSGLSVNSFTFTFTQNANSTLSMGFVGDGVTWFDVTSPEGMDTDIEHIPLTWDLVKVGSPVAGLIVLSGVQTATFAATMTRDLIYEIGTFLPIDKPSQHPHTVTVTLNGLANDVKLSSWLNKFATDFDANNPNNLVTVKVSKQGDAATDWIVASGLRPSTATMNAAVGANSTVDLVFTGASLTF